MPIFQKQLSIHCLYFLTIQLVDDSPAQLQRIGELTALHRERMGQQRKSLDLLEAGKTRLQASDTLLYQLDNLFVADQVFERTILYLHLTGILRERLIRRNDNGGNKLALVAYNGHPLGILFAPQAALFRLRCDILALGGGLL